MLQKNGQKICPFFICLIPQAVPVLDEVFHTGIDGGDHDTPHDDAADNSNINMKIYI